MTEIYIGENSGFCFGVKRAIDKTLEVSNNGSSRVATLGYIIHNTQAVRKLKDFGVKIIEDPQDFENQLNGVTHVIIRTHGVKKEITEKLKQKMINFFDATCPFVIRSQRIVEKFSDLGYDIVIFGNPDHPEVVGVISYAKGRVYVVQNPQDVEKLPFMRKVVVVSQTTQKLDDFIEVVKKILERGFEVRVFNTVCEVTIDAQKEAYDIAKISDIVIVVGGRMSSNTDKLYKVCKDLVETHKIETADELLEDWVANKNKIGIVAGTSTPDWVIKEVIDKIKKLKQDDIKIIKVGKKNKFSAEDFSWE